MKNPYSGLQTAVDNLESSLYNMVQQLGILLEAMGEQYQETNEKLYNTFLMIENLFDLHYDNVKAAVNDVSKAVTEYKAGGNDK